MQELKGDKINEGIMKEITGGDPIQGRALFKDTMHSLSVQASCNDQRSLTPRV